MIVVDIIISFILMVASLLAIIGNFIILLVIYHSPTLHDTAGFLMANIAVADFGTGLLVLPFLFIAYAIDQQFFIEQIAFCKSLAWFNTFFVASSVISIIAITADRVLAVVMPLKYHSLTTIRKVQFMIVMIWLSSAIYASLPLVGLQNIGFGLYSYVNESYQCWMDIHDKANNGTFLLIVFVQVILIFAVVVTCYFVIFCLAKKSNRRVILMDSRNIGRGKYRRPSAITKTTKTTLLIISIFACCWIPSIINIFLSPAIMKQAPVIVRALCTWTIIFNSSLNPIIYGAHNQLFRSRFIKLWRRNCRLCVNNRIDLACHNSHNCELAISRMNKRSESELVICTINRKSDSDAPV